MELKPSEIFYSQDSICKTFGDHCAHRGQLIGETLDDICDGRCTIYEIPRIKVINRNGKWVTCDNRRLWVFRHLERLGKCDKIHVQVASYIPIQKLTSLSDGREIKVRGRPGGIWHNKPSKRREHLTPKPLTYNRRVYNTETPSPRPLHSGTSTPGYTSSYQHTNMMIHKPEEVTRPVYVAPSSSRSTSQQGFSTGYYDYGAASSTRSSVHSTGTGYYEASSMFGRINQAPQVETNWHQPQVRPYAAPQTHVTSDIYSDRQNRPVTHNEIGANSTIRSQTGYDRNSERKTPSRPTNNGGLSKQHTTVYLLPDDDYQQRRRQESCCSCVIL